MLAMTDTRPKKKPEQVIQRKGWSVEQQAVHGDLCHWGPRYRRILLSDGYSPFSPFAGLLEGRGGRFMSRVLVPDMTERAWRTNREVWSLPTDLAWALVARYALPPRDVDGQLFTSREIGQALDCSPDTYRQRVTEGRKKLRLLIFS